MFHSSEMQFHTERVLLTSMPFLQDVMNHRLWDTLLKGSINSESLLKQTLHNSKPGQTKVNKKTVRCRNWMPSSAYSQLISPSLLQSIGNAESSGIPSGRITSASPRAYPTISDPEQVFVQDFRNWSTVSKRWVRHVSFLIEFTREFIVICSRIFFNNEFFKVSFSQLDISWLSHHMTFFHYAKALGFFSQRCVCSG